MAPGPIDRRRCSVAEAAQVLGVSVFTVRVLIRQRRLAYHRIGRRIVLDRQDLEEFLRAHRVEPRELQTKPPRRPWRASQPRQRSLRSPPGSAGPIRTETASPADA